VADPDIDEIRIDPVLCVLIAQLIDKGVLDGDDISDMMRRLEEGGDGELASDLVGIVLSCGIDTPANRRAGMHVVDGGNSEG
jgi:hypothetical protein